MVDEAVPVRTAAVVGGGPAGLMAAQVLAERGLRVTVYDQMPTLGRKFLLAGRSGLNLTHSEDTESLLARYGTARPRLEHAIRAFDAPAVRNWAQQLGEATYVGSSGRVFPDSWRATTLLRSWLRHLASLGVRAETHTRWVGWADGGEAHGSGVVIELLQHDGTVRAERVDVVVLALGGGSWPRTGSDGRWVDTLRHAGITVHELAPSNAGATVPWPDAFLERFEGSPLKNVVVHHGTHGARGELVITRDGLEGTPVYALSPSLREALRSTADTTLHLDLHPDLDDEQVKRRLAVRRPKDSFANWVRRRLGLGPIAVALLRVAAGGSPPGDVDALVRLVKRLPVQVTGLSTLDRAISTAGGVALDAVDDRLMLTGRPGTFVAGEMLDWDAPTGGYLLQATFSLAVLAAHGAADWATEEAR